MRILITPLIFICFALTAASSIAQQTAYQALRALAAQRDQTFLTRVVEISGNQGTTQPLVWKITIDDPAARGSVREFELSDGRILSERAPVRILSQGGSRFVLNLANLNLDSDGAFTVANDQAKKQLVGFDSVNYLLRADDSSGTPVWQVSLLDQTGTTVGKITLSGKNGAIVRSEGLVPRNPADATTWPATERSGDGGFIGRSNESLHRAGQSVRQGSLRALGSVQEWLTGRRTIDRDDPPTD